MHALNPTEKPVLTPVKKGPNNLKSYLLTTLSQVIPTHQISLQLYFVIAKKKYTLSLQQRVNICIYLSKC